MAQTSLREARDHPGHRFDARRLYDSPGISAVISATTASIRSRSASIEAEAASFAFCNTTLTRCSTTSAPSRRSASWM